MGELSTHFPMSSPAISQHLRILKDARLVAQTVAGTRRLYAIDPEGFDELRRYFDRFWGSGLSPHPGQFVYGSSLGAIGWR